MVVKVHLQRDELPITYLAYGTLGTRIPGEGALFVATSLAVYMATEMAGASFLVGLVAESALGSSFHHLAFTHAHEYRVFE